MYITSDEILAETKSILANLEVVDSLLTNLQCDIDTNKKMREAIEWDYEDLRKTMTKAVFEANKMVENAESEYGRD